MKCLSAIKKRLSPHYSYCGTCESEHPNDDFEWKRCGYVRTVQCQHCGGYQPVEVHPGDPDEMWV